MNTFIKEYGDCLYEVFVKFNQDEVTEEYNKSVKGIQERAKFDGYRQGKVPTDIIEKNFTDDISNSMFRSMLNQAVQKMKNDNILVYSEPHIKPLSNLIKNAPFSFSILFESAPQVKKGIEIGGLQVEYEEVFIDEKMVDSTIGDYCKTLESVSGKIEDGDSVTVKVIGAENSEKTLDSKIVKPLIGHKKGEKVKIALSDLGNYLIDFIDTSNTDVEVEITEVERPTVPQLTDELVKELTHYPTLSEYRNAVRKSMENNAKSMNDYAIRTELINEVVKNCEVIFPKSMFVNDCKIEFNRFVDNNLNLSEVKITELIADKSVEQKYTEVLKKTYDNIVFYLSVMDYAVKNNIAPDKDTLNSVASSYARREELSLEDYKKKATKEEWDNVQDRARFETALNEIVSKVKTKAKTKKPFIKVK